MERIKKITLKDLIDEKLLENNKIALQDIRIAAKRAEDAVSFLQKTIEKYSETQLND